MVNKHLGQGEHSYLHAQQQMQGLIRHAIKSASNGDMQKMYAIERAMNWAPLYLDLAEQNRCGVAVAGTKQEVAQIAKGLSELRCDIPEIQEGYRA